MCDQDPEIPDMTNHLRYDPEVPKPPETTSYLSDDLDFQTPPEIASLVNYDVEVQEPSTYSSVNCDPEVQILPEPTSPLYYDEGVSFSWTGVSVEVPEKVSHSWRRKSSSVKMPTRLVKDSTGMLKPGQMLAIMGASGAGKSSLLNALTCRNMDGLQVKGKRFVNDCLVTPDCLTAVSAYLQQDDLFIGTLTVREHLVFQVSDNIVGEEVIYFFD